MARSLAAAVVTVLVCGLFVAPVGAADTGTAVVLDGETGDFVSSGRDWRYDRNNALIRASHGDRLVRVIVRGHQHWDGTFAAPQGQARLSPGRYEYAGSGMWSGNGRGCNTAKGWFHIDRIAFDHGEMTSLSMRFTQRCDGATEALRGHIDWTADSSAPRPANPRPEPAGRWRPPADAIPDRGNVIYLQSAKGDYIGAGKTLLYQPKADQIEVQAGADRIGVRLLQSPWWSGDFAAPLITSHLQPGYYGALNRFPFDNPVEGGMDWGGDGRGCNRLTGWFALDRMKTVAGELRAFTIRFVQHCETRDAAPLRGFIRWRAVTPAPVQPFTDVAGHRHERAINRVAAEGWMTGFSDGTFRPEGDVSRGQIATMIHRALGWGAPSPDAPDFSDIASSPHRDAIRKLAENKIVFGYADGTYRPDLAVTRGHVATLLNRAFLRYEGEPHNAFFFDALGTRHDLGTRAFIDGDIARPVGSGRFYPGRDVTRAAMAVFLGRAANIVQDLRY